MNSPKKTKKEIELPSTNELPHNDQTALIRVFLRVITGLSVGNFDAVFWRVGTFVQNLQPKLFFRRASYHF